MGMYLHLRANAIYAFAANRILQAPLLLWRAIPARQEPTQLARVRGSLQSVNHKKVGIKVV
jgi:hypothetical protein